MLYVMPCAEGSTQEISTGATQSTADPTVAATAGTAAAAAAAAGTGATTWTTFDADEYFSPFKSTGRSQRL